jgi:L-fuconolactonase
VAIIDAQVHAYERDHPGRPWQGKIHGPDAVPGDQHVEAMDKAGVDGALLVSPWSVYKTDFSYAVGVRNTYPERFAMIAPVEPYAPGVAERVAEWASTPGAVGIRLMVGYTDDFRADDPAVKEAVGAAERCGLPICVFCWNKLPMMREIAAVYPDAQFVVDHLGLPQPLEPPAPERPFAQLDEVLRLASFPNVAMKVTGACTLSHQPFPFDDLWQPLGRMFDAFGLDRCMWGTDWTRALDLVDYVESVSAFKQTPTLSQSDRDALMGGTLSRIFSWAPTT